MKLRTLTIFAISSLFWIASFVITPAASALIQVNLSDIDYHECPPELAEGIVNSNGTSRMADCYLVTGKAENKSGKPIYDADVYGRIYDANGNPVMQNRTRVGLIDEVPPGVSDFQIRITVPANQPTPLKLEQFKASGFAGTVRRY